jgi:hypothetical protein
MKTLFFAVIGLLIGHAARGSEMFPTLLPIDAGSYATLKWLVTHGECRASVSLKFKSANGSIASFGNSGEIKRFGSYEEYESYRVWVSRSHLNIAPEVARSSTKVYYYFSLEYRSHPEMAWQPGFQVNTEFDTTVSAIHGIPTQTMKPLKIQFEIPQAGMIIVRSGSQPPYLWKTNFGTTLSMSPLTSADKARVTVVSGDGSRATYTQTGNLLVPAIVSLVDSNTFWLSITPGSDTVIESTTNMVQWSEALAMPWPYQEIFTVPIPRAAGREREFFRVRSE